MDGGGNGGKEPSPSPPPLCPRLQGTGTVLGTPQKALRCPASSTRPGTARGRRSSRHGLLGWGTETGEPRCHRAPARATPAPWLLPTAITPRAPGQLLGRGRRSRSSRRLAAMGSGCHSNRRLILGTSSSPTAGDGVGVSATAEGTARADPSGTQPDPRGSPAEAGHRLVPGVTVTPVSPPAAGTHSGTWQRRAGQGSKGDVAAGATVTGVSSTRQSTERSRLVPGGAGSSRGRSSPSRGWERGPVWRRAREQPSRLAGGPGTPAPAATARHAGLSPGTARATGTDSGSGHPRPPPFLRGKLCSF